ncbi:hypothetical protein KX928_02560 [Roseobacter sp. YSTF-M11]|uniref:Uncharacterized protein n=1 Tax=Roseobacter insulae TaxID=2859783 RepID=A0A9X1FT67_9RHOB|nr:hypothetical protein [Roseobacter insulae]MBW4706660.1 hypothetical protein [Roseobacter insulae]
MGYSEILRLTLAHAYFGNDVPPLTVAPADTRDFDVAGCLLRQRGAVTIVLVDDAMEERPAGITLTLGARTPQVIEVTEGAVWGAPISLSVPLDVDTVRLSDVDAPETPQDTLRLEAVLATLQIAVPPEGQREVTLSLTAKESFWAYHLTGQTSLDGLEVIDSEGDVTFEDLGLADLPDGRPVRVIRSTRAVAARARPSQRFALQKAGPFGPETLIAVLPGAAPPFKPIQEAGAPMRLQSDIFVTLW